MAIQPASPLHDPAGKPAGHRANRDFEARQAELEILLDRILGGSPLAEIADIPGLARVIAATFIGLELYDGADPQGAQRALDALDALGSIFELIDDLGPVASRVLRAKARRTI